MNLTPQTPPHPGGDKRFELLDVAIKRRQFRQDVLIEILYNTRGRRHGARHRVARLRTRGPLPGEARPR
jgi:hypothetical protein